MKTLVEWRREGVRARGPVRRRVVRFRIDIPPHPGRFPIQPKDMKALGKTPGLQCKSSSTRGMVPGPAGVMKRAMNSVWFMAQQFHDVDFAASRPTAVATVGGQHPDGRPETLSLRQLRSDLESSSKPV